MSNLWCGASAGAAASVGTFAISLGHPIFTPSMNRQGSGLGDAPADDEPDLDTLLAEAFAQGVEEGRRAAEIEFEGEREVLARLLETVDVLRPEPSNALALLLAETVDRLVRQIVGSVEVDGDLLTRRAEAAALLIADETGPACMHVNPDDLALIDQSRVPVNLVVDSKIERGSLLLRTGQGWIEDGPAVRLDRLRAELDRMGALT